MMNDEPKQTPVEFSHLNITLPHQPKLAIVIPSKNRNDLLFGCIDSILQNTQYQNYKIYVADTGSNPAVLNEFTTRYQEVAHIELIKFNFYNFAKINNMVIKHMVDADTELVLCCNNDIQMLNDAISLMVLTYLHNEPTVGTVGARLHYASGQIQHLGIKYSRQPNDFLLSHYMAGQDFQRSHHPEGLHLIKSYGNTAAFMLMSRQVFLMLDGYNENYHQCFEDAELNLKLLAMGKQNLLPIDAVCYHFESQTRRDNEKQNIDYQDFQRIKHFLALHHHQIEYFLQSKS